MLKIYLRLYKMEHSKPMIKCTRCILPESFPNIKFDDKGVCNYCLSYKPIKCKGEAALRNLLNSYRNKGRKYDCLVPISGGKDSAFVLYHIVKTYKMRTLAFNYNSGFASKQSKENIRNMINSLNVDFVSIKSRRDIQKRCLRSNIIAWTRKPTSELFPTFCYGCQNGIDGGANQITKEMKIPLIVFGQSEVERQLILRGQEVLTRYHELYPIHLFIKFMKNPFYLNPINLCNYFLLNMEFLSKINGLVRRINFFDYVDYLDEKEILSTIVSELKWKKGDLNSPWRFDCQIHALIDYMFKKKLGFTEKEEILSQMIREKKLSRTEALKRIEREKQDEESLLIIMNEVFNKLELSKKQRNRILLC